MRIRTVYNYPAIGDEVTYIDLDVWDHLAGFVIAGFVLLGVLA